MDQTMKSQDNNLPSISNKLTSGFTLIELMIVVAIIAILAAVAYPSYQRHLQKTRRSDALDHLQFAAHMQERFLTLNNAYATTVVALGISATSKQGYYTLAIATPTTTTFTLTVTPVAGSTQLNDTNCQQFTFSSQGLRTANDASDGSGTVTTAICWPQ